MRRHLFRPFFDFPQPFLFNRVFIPRLRARVITTPENQLRVQQQKPNSHKIFEEFFNEQGIKTQAQKQFFRKHFPEKINEPQEIKCPYKILGLQKTATQEQINEAYRNLAMKYHPKVDASEEASKKFDQISEAFQQLKDKNLEINESGPISTKSFFEDFQRDIDKFFDVFNEPFLEKKQVNEKSQTKQSMNNSQEKLNGFYSQSSYIENRNGKNQKVVIEKKYMKDGKILTVKREQMIKNDGTREVTETVDDGKEVKKKVFIEGQQKKALA